jgi:hypothetical protein
MRPLPDPPPLRRGGNKLCGPSLTLPASQGREQIPSPACGGGAREGAENIALHQSAFPVSASATSLFTCSPIT